MTDSPSPTPDCLEASDPRALPAEPLVSVHMLAFNHGPYLADAIEGVIAQRTDFPIELIIGDDHSTDDTLRIALDYQARFPHLVRVLHGPTNVGMHANYQRVLERCRGEFVAICEGDDYWIDEQKLTTQVAFLRKNQNCSLVHSDFWHRIRNRFRLASEALRGADSCPIRGPQAWRLMMNGMWVGACTWCARVEPVRLFFNQHYNRIRRFSMIDYPVLLDLAFISEIGYLDKPVAVYRYHAGSAMNAGRPNNLRVLKSLIECRNEFLHLHGLREALSIEQAAEGYRLLLATAYGAGDAGEYARAYAWLAANGLGGNDRIRDLMRRTSLKHRPLLWLVRLRSQWLTRRSIRQSYIRVDPAPGGPSRLYPATAPRYDGKAT
jgi:glycosyltransferase involved in cell wall biosynthesis